MKTIRLILMGILVSGSALLSSCSSDDSSSSESSIVGKWYYSKTITQISNGSPNTQNYEGNEVGCDKDYQEFLESGNIFRDVVLYKNASDVCTEDSENGAWAKTGDQLTLTGNSAGTYEIVKLTNSELRYQSTITNSGVTLTVTQVFTKG